MNLELSGESTAVQDNALEASRVIRPFGAVRPILGNCASAKIIVSVIDAVAVVVIDMRRRVVVQDKAMHQYTRTFAINYLAADSVKGSAFAVLFGRPVELIKEFVSMCADKAIQALSESNDAVGWIKRLDNSVSFHVAFHGERHLLVQQSAALLNFTRSPAFAV